MPETNVNQNPQVNTPITPPGYPHKWLVGVLIALLVVAVAVTIVFAVSKKVGKSVPNENEAVICTDDAKICPDGSEVGREGPNCEFAMCPGELDTSGWQTYRNEEFGFEFKYPQSYEVQEYTEENDKPQGSNIWLRAGDKYQSDAEWLIFDLTVYATNKTSLEEILVERNPDSILKSEHYLQGQYLETDGLPGYQYIYFDSERGKYFIVGSGSEYIKSEELKQILSTFRFVDVTVLPASLPPEGTGVWKLYKNQEYYFEFEYPDSILVGERSKSSVLGEAGKDVPGIFVGHFVFVPLNSSKLVEEGFNYYQGYKDYAINPPPEETEFPPIGCDLIPVENPEVHVELVYCVGDGGPATYGIIDGSELDIFIDGYSRGWTEKDTTYLGYLNQEELVKLLPTFRFLP